jgi:hypothetical protein
MAKLGERIRTEDMKLGKSGMIYDLSMSNIHSL